MQALELELTPTPRAVAEARSAVTRGFAPHLTSDALDDLRLLITELVANAVLHSGLLPHESIQVRVSGRGGSVHAEVIDCGRDGEIRPRPLDPASPGGFGLHLVDELSDRWGVRHNGVTCVWFELTRRETARAV